MFANEYYLKLKFTKICYSISYKKNKNKKYEYRSKNVYERRNYKS